MKKIEIVINGVPVKTSPGKTILEVVEENKIDDIPTLCHSPELKPYGSCFVCVVEVKGKPNLVPSCSTVISPGMNIETGNERVKTSRKTALELLLSNHYADCISPCMEGCPAGVDAQGYIALSAMGLYTKAVDLIRESNPLPAICGRVCVRKCEVVCRREDIDSPVGINAIKRFLTDTPETYSDNPVCEPATGKTIAIIGAGPAGLTAAWFLGKKGHKTIIFEAKERSGGMLRYGIPAYRLPDDVIDAEVDYICRTGTEIRYNQRVGNNISLEELRDKYDSVFLASGAWAGKPMRVEGEFDTEGVVTGADFLPKIVDNQKKMSGTVIVVGGGNTAMDVARSSWRLGADKVIILYRRTKKEMPADKMEIEDCLEEGIEIMELAAPVGIIKENDRIKAIRCIRMKLGEIDKSGRQRPVPMEGSEFDLPCSLAVSAIGQAPVLSGIESAGGKKLELTKWNTILIDLETMKTNIEGVFAGGDAADDGPTVVIDAIRDGKKGAEAIHNALLDTPAEKKPFTVKKSFWSKPGKGELGDIIESPRHNVHLIEVEDRINNFNEVASGFEYEDNIHETNRCLSCGCVSFNDCSLRLYSEEYNVDMERFKGHVRKHKVDDRHPYLIYDPNKCILCSRCIRTCSNMLTISAIGLIDRGFKTEMRPAMNDPLSNTSCISCGNCVDSCPTGALTVKYPFQGRSALPIEEIPTFCGFCSLLCPITVKKFGSGKYFIESSGTPGQYLCKYGRFGYELFQKKKRIISAEIRDNGNRKKASVKDAVNKTISTLKQIISSSDASATAVFVSPELSNEELYLAGRIAREGLGTGNIGSLSILETNRESGILDTSFGFTASTSDKSCIKDADLIICNNSSIEEDHLPLAVEVKQAVKEGASLIISNSTINMSDQMVSTLTLDPMRGRAAVLWNGIIETLIDEKYFTIEKIEAIPGGKAFLIDRETAEKDISSITGINNDDIIKAAGIISSSNKIVFIHSPDRTLDQAPGDMETIANLIVLLKAKGISAELLLPEAASNNAALEITGADPAFTAGRIPVSGELKGAASREELRNILTAGELKGAIIIGEDPMAWDTKGVMFRNMECLSVMDWTMTETAEYADIILPGSIYLESDGLKCNYEGKLTEFKKATDPPAGISGKDILLMLAKGFNISIPDNIKESMKKEISSKIGNTKGYYLNTGEKKVLPKPLRLVVPEMGLKAGTVKTPMTTIESYKKELKEIGIERFKIR